MQGSFSFRSIRLHPFCGVAASSKNSFIAVSAENPTVSKNTYVYKKAGNCEIYNVPQNSDSDLRWETSKPRTDKRGDPNEENTKKF